MNLTGRLSELAARLSAASPQIPVTPTREEARRAAIEELSHREYRDAEPGLLTQFLDWLFAHLVVGVHGPVSAVLLSVLVLALVVVIVVALARAGQIRAHRARRGGQDSVFDDPTLTAADHRAAADRHAAAGQWAAAVLERFRAIVRELEERAVLVPLPARTAGEAAFEAQRWLPQLGGDLAAAARLFNDVRYGGRTADEAADEGLRSLDEKVRRARPLETAESAGPRLVAPS
jgi:hypothetical protein